MGGGAASWCGVIIRITGMSNKSGSKVLFRRCAKHKKGKDRSLDIAPIPVLDSGALKPRKWQLTGIDCSTTAQGSDCP